MVADLGNEKTSIVGKILYESGQRYVLGRGRERKEEEEESTVGAGTHGVQSVRVWGELEDVK